MGTGLQVDFFDRMKPCAICNMTKQARENPLTKRCIPYNLVMLQVVSPPTDHNSTLEALPRLTSLRTLALGPGNIKTVGSGTFSRVPNLLTLTMNRNCIQTVGKWFGLIWKLKKLYLSWNEIKEIEKDALQPLVDLEHLDLTHNRLRAVEKWHFEGLTKLKCLKLSYNDISHIAGKAFHPLWRIEIIWLDHNKLAYFKPAWLEDLPQWVNFHLEHNLLKTISANSLSAMMRRYSPYVYVANNPFRCTCALHSMKSEGPKALQDYESLQCSYPPSLLGRNIANMSQDDMLCQMNGGITEQTIKANKEDPIQDCTTLGADKQGHIVFKTTSNTTTLVSQNATITKETNQTTAMNPLPNCTTSETNYLTNHTVMLTINTTTPSRQHKTITERIIILDTMDKTSPQEEHLTTLSYISSACLALFLLGGITTACRKCYKMRQQHRNHVQGNAADAAGDIPLQPAPANATGNPAPVQHAYAEIPDEINTDITPYATTVDMANPMYNATSTEPKALAASIPDPPPADPPPQSNRHTTYNPSSQPEGTETSRAGMMPDSPPRPDRHINYKASTRPQSSDMTQMGRIQAQPPRSNRRIPYGASSQQSSEIPTVHVQEIQDPIPRSKRHINSPRAPSQPQGLQIPSGEEVPDLPPRSNKYVNSNVPSQQRS
ncbi:LRFN4 [Branchiostoma lanceolatum]|uniref:LRFN4 protein n=1 Tax=Branchiostoma lanceolatum TaxID=7740 RepID=A0A8K0EEB2_BRALA|nr:LRFN4 [Branchiostoma lanceolatum]